MSIVFRNVKGSALTYTEMDRNQAQFFYSASVNANNLELHYTGSSILNTEGQLDFIPRSVTIPLGSGGSSLSLTQGTGISITNNAQGQTVITNTGTATPGGDNTSIQFNDGGSFGGDNLFVYDKTNDRVGIGITSGMTRRLHINDNSTGGAIIRLNANPLNSSATKLAYLEISNTGTPTAQIGRINTNSNSTYIHNTDSNFQKTFFSFGNINTGISATVTNVGIGIGTQSPGRDLSILSDSKKGIGISAGDERGIENRIRILPDAVWETAFVDTNNDRLDINRYGLGIHTPIPGSGEGGNMLIAVSDTREGINENRDPNRLLITAYNTEVVDSLEGAPVHIASFTAAGRVGIHTPDPNQDIRLDVNGQYRGAYLETTAITKLDFKNYSVINFTPTQGSNSFTLSNTVIPPAGTKAVLILGTNSVDYDVIFSSDSNLITGSNLSVTKDTTGTITFVSDGTNLIETSRTTNLS